MGGGEKVTAMEVPGCQAGCQGKGLDWRLRISVLPRAVRSAAYRAAERYGGSLRHANRVELVPAPAWPCCQCGSVPSEVRGVPADGT